MLTPLLIHNVYSYVCIISPLVKAEITELLFNFQLTQQKTQLAQIYCNAIVLFFYRKFVLVGFFVVSIENFEILLNPTAEPN